MIWHDMTWYDMTYDIWHDMIYITCHDMINDMTWYDMTWHDMIYDMTWYDIWYDIYDDMIWYNIFLFYYNIYWHAPLHFWLVILHAMYNCYLQWLFLLLFGVHPPVFSCLIAVLLMFYSVSCVNLFNFTHIFVYKGCLSKLRDR